MDFKIVSGRNFRGHDYLPSLVLKDCAWSGEPKLALGGIPLDLVIVAEDKPDLSYRIIYCTMYYR